MAYTTINKGSSYFNTKLYTGTGATNSVTGVGFQPDWVWIKIRNQTFDHTLVDAVRGVQKDLESNTTAAEDTRSTVTVFGSDGFTVGTDSQVNSNTNTFVAWNWLANNTSGSSNTAGSITATVAANTTSGFSVGKTTGTLTSGTITVGHSLGVAPSMIFWKRTDGVSNWQVYHKSTGTGLLQLNQTSAVNTSASFWPATSNITFSVANNLYGSGETYAFYCFAEVKGYSKFGSYTGNGSADGTFVYTGFKPAFIMYKNTATAGTDWVILDVKRDPYNVATEELYADLQDAEGTAANNMDILSNGFKPRRTNASVNGSGATIIYMAFAENPFVTSGGIPVTAR